MNPILQTVLEAVTEAESQGVDSISTESLKAYLAKLNNFVGIHGKEPTDAELEEFKSYLSRQIEDHRVRNQWDFEMFRATISAGQSALRSAVLINGGGAVALLTFIGKLWGNTDTQAILLASPLQTLLIGVLLASIATGTTYFTQWFYGQNNEKLEKVGSAFNLITIALGLGSYGCFLAGVISATRVFGT